MAAASTAALLAALFLHAALLLPLLPPLLSSCEAAGMWYACITAHSPMQDGLEELATRRQELLTKLAASLGLDSEAAGVCTLCRCCQYSHG